jgi:hypothetical protein
MLADTELTEDFFWRARSALDVLNAGPACGRARAARLWAELYRTVHAPRDETGAERSERIGRIDKLAAVAGLAPIMFHLQEFALDLAHAELTSPDSPDPVMPHLRREGQRAPLKNASRWRWLFKKSDGSKEKRLKMRARKLLRTHVHTSGKKLSGASMRM